MFETLNRGLIALPPQNKLHGSIFTKYYLFSYVLYKNYNPRPVTLPVDQSYLRYETLFVNSLILFPWDSRCLHDP